MRILILSVVSILFILTGSSCKKEQNDTQEEFISDSMRIVSLTPSITKQLYLLGVEDLVVGHTSYCPSEGLKNSELVASAMEVNVEKIATLHPDIVLVTTLVKSKIVDKLKMLGINVQYLPSPKSFNEICNQFIELGAAVERKSKAISIVKAQEEKLDSLQNTIPPGKKLKYFIEIGAKPLYAATPESFMHDYIRYANGINIAEGLKSGTMSRESVIVKNPDVIVIVTMGIVGKEEKEIWQDYPNLNASKNGRIFVIDSDLASSPTPITFTNVVGKIINKVYNQNN